MREAILLSRVSRASVFALAQRPTFCSRYDPLVSHRRYPLEDQRMENAALDADQAAFHFRDYSFEADAQTPAKRGRDPCYLCQGLQWICVEHPRQPGWHDDCPRDARRCPHCNRRSSADLGGCTTVTGPLGLRSVWMRVENTQPSVAMRGQHLVSSPTASSERHRVVAAPGVAYARKNIGNRVLPCCIWP